MVVLSFEFKERKMKLEGLKANFLGDSITEGHGVENLEDTYWNVLKENVVWQRPGIWHWRYQNCKADTSV